MAATESPSMSPKNLALTAALALPFAFATISPAPAMAMTMIKPDFRAVSCLARGTLRDYLDRAYGEGRIAQGELENGNQVELFVSRQGTWTLVEMTPDGQGCVHAYGKRMKLDGGGRPARHSPS
jgi:hypothetical protein|tara:strand:+ start:232 stop:603 length:372 start_codon:yes stop_codon:yes gene_type:complete